MDQPPPSIYFGGSAFGCAFYIGVHRAMAERWGRDYYKKIHITGDSAGSVMATCMALGYSDDDISRVYLRMAQTARRGGVFYNRAEAARVGLVEEVFKRVPKAFSLVRSRLSIGITVYPFGHVWKTHWSSNEDLLDTILASMHIPLYTPNENPYFLGNKCVDGACSMHGEALVHGDRTLFVGFSPFAEISSHLSLIQLLQPHVGDDFHELVDEGYRSFLAWDGQLKKKVGLWHPNYSILMVMWLCRSLEPDSQFLLTFWSRFNNLYGISAHSELCYDKPIPSSWSGLTVGTEESWESDR